MGSQLEPLDDVIVRNVLLKFATCSTEHALLALDRRGAILWASSGAAEILGAPATELVGLNAADFFLQEDIDIAIPEHELEVALQSGAATDDRWMARADRSRFWASGATIFLNDEAGPAAFLKIFRDLTEQKMQLETARERLSAAALATDNMSGAIALLAHELRNPLGGISLGVEILERLVPDDGNIARQLQGIGTSLKHATLLVADLMEHSQVSSKGYRLNPDLCTLRDLLETSASIALHQTGQTGRHVAVIVPAGDIEIRVDRMRMQQVFVNLVANALRYTPLPGRIWVTGTVEGTEVIVRVSDEGIGIEPEQLESLFDAFTGHRPAGNRLGLGLGLSLVKKIVELHGGSVQAHSEGVNKGSQFTVRFAVETMQYSPPGD
jgi:PAS domain S-box-containing protein